MPIDPKSLRDLADDYSYALTAEDKCLLRDAADEIERLRGSVVAAYRAWVQPDGSSQFVKDEAKRLVMTAAKGGAQ